MNSPTSTTTASWKRGEGPLALAAFAAVTALIIFFLLRDASDLVNSTQDELLGHVGASAGFTVAGAGTLIVWRRRQPSLLLVLLTGAVLTLAGELAQGLVPARGVELRDIASGFSGVLIAGIVIEALLKAVSLQRALRAHATTAALAAVVLAVVLVVDLTPASVYSATPDGATCPRTTLTGDGDRISIGADLAGSNSCVQTEVGGFGVFGNEGADTLTEDTVLVSSTLNDLSMRIRSSGKTTIRTAFTTGLFPETAPKAGVILILQSPAAGQLLQIRTRGARIEVFGPIRPGFPRAAALPQALEEDTRHEIEVELSAGELTIHLDGRRVATASVDPVWMEAFVADDLQLLIGNSTNRTLPFHGTIEWIEIDT